MYGRFFKVALKTGPFSEHQTRGLPVRQRTKLVTMMRELLTEVRVGVRCGFYAR